MGETPKSTTSANNPGPGQAAAQAAWDECCADEGIRPTMRLVRELAASSRSAP